MVNVTGSVGECLENSDCEYSPVLYYALVAIIPILVAFLMVFVKRIRAMMAVKPCVYQTQIVLDNANTDQNVKLSDTQNIRNFISSSCPKLFPSPPKDISLLDLDDIRKLRYLENKESQEDVHEYETGGYMPVNVGEILRSQYEVCRKLGWGHFSTVWLCKNIVDKAPKYVALKICKSAQMFTAVANDEIRLLQETKTVNPQHIGYSCIVQMVDTFRLISENGIHTAISLEIMGPSLLHLLLQSNFRGIQVPSVRKIIYQVLLGLSYLHDECHIIHTDIKPENILIKVDENYIKEVLGKMERFSELGIELPRTYVRSGLWSGANDNTIESSDDENILSRFDERASSYPSDIYLKELVTHKDRHTQKRLSSPMWVNPNIEVKIADLGNGCWEDHHFSEEIQTRQYRALEVILAAGYSYPADIWSVGCMAFELATGEMMFSPKGDELSANLDHLCLIWETLGGIPRYITETGAESKKYFKDGVLKGISMDEIKVWKTEDVLVEKYKWKRVDAIPFASFLESLIEPDPGLRATASQALSNEWLLYSDI